MTPVDDVDLRGVHREVLVLDHHRLADEVGQRARGLDPGRAAADDDEVQGAGVEQARVAVGRLEDGDDARPQTRRVVERVQRQRVPLGALGPEEVRQGARPR